MDIFRRASRGKHPLYFYTSIGLVALLLLLMHHAYFSSNEYWKGESMKRELGLRTNILLSNREKLSLVRNDARHTNMSGLYSNLTIHHLLNNIEVVCHQKLHFGHLDKGGWEICDDEYVRPRNQCIVYSFTINTDFSFEDQIAFYGCHVYAFDPIMEDGRYNRSSHVHVYNGVSYLKKDPQAGDISIDMKSLSHVRTMMGHKMIDVVKMDRASTEWWNIYKTIGLWGVKGVRQLVLGVQVAPLPGEGEDVFDGSITVEERLAMLWQLNVEGFRVFDSYKNPACGVRVKEFVFVKTMCYEVAYMFVQGSDSVSRLARKKEREEEKERKLASGVTDV